MGKKVAVILSGCGYLDGAEITEAISTLISLSQHGLEYQCFAPDIDVPEIDHTSGKETGQKRNVLKESARIARGNVLPLSELQEKDFSAIVLPGGYGAAKNLSNFAEKGASGEVNPQLKKSLEDFHASQKPIAAICIAPAAAVALSLGNKGVSVTIGNDEATAGEIRKTGAEHINCKVDDFVVDTANKVITTPAYMYEATPAQAFTGIQKSIQALAKMI